MNHPALPASIAGRRRSAWLMVAVLAAVLAAGRDAAAVPSGTLDASFGGGTGIVTQAIGTSADEGFALAIDLDGRLVVAGYAIESRQKFGLARFTATGVLDTTFDGDGKKILAVRTTLDHVRAVLIQDDGKIVLAGYSRGAGNDDFALVRLLDDGNLDPGFGNAGVVTTAIGTSDDEILAAALQDDGKIVVAGYSRGAQNRDVVLARYLTNGALDPSFGSGGKVVQPLGAADDEASAIAIQSDHKIVIAGYAASGGQREMLLARFAASGALDPTLNGTGSLRIGFGSGDEFARGVAVQPDGAILVAGYAHVGTVDQFAVARVSATGVLDPSFDGDGKLTTLIGTEAQGHALALHPRGRFVVAGWARFNGNLDTALAQYRPDGSLDPTFGNGGIVRFAIADKIDEANAVAIQDDGNVVVAGTARLGTNVNSADFALARLIVNRCGDGFVDPEETCDSLTLGGVSCCSTACEIAPSGAVCRASAGLCDVVETCDGVATDCPADDWQPQGAVCRAAAGICDVPESCNGLGPQCPGDQRVAAQTLCRAATDLCDAAERCNGVAADCPTDLLAAAGLVCRSGSDACDAAERCDGASPACPVDALSPAGTTCRLADGICDVAETCDGLVASCPSDVFKDAGTACRGVANTCDVAESCSGASALCPTDLHLPDGDADGTCDAEDVCPQTSDPTQLDRDADGLGDACDPCTLGKDITAAALRISDFTTPAGDDSVKLRGIVNFATTPVLTPETKGVRVLIHGPDGATLFDVTVPSGAYDPDTRTGWTFNGARTLMKFRTPTAIGGLVNKVNLRLRQLRPGYVQMKITGRNAAFAAAPLPTPLSATVVFDPTQGGNGICGEMTFPGPAPAPFCRLDETGATLVCR